jgi:hypothetical protein
MAMREKSKATSWKYDGRRGRKISKKLANTYERRQAKKEIKEANMKGWMLIAG